MPAKRTGGGNVETSWSAWYWVARDEMSFRYGIRRVPEDRYREQRALGLGPREAAGAIFRDMQARGEVKS